MPHRYSRPLCAGLCLAFLCQAAARGTADEPKEKPDSKARSEKNEKPAGKIRLPGAEQTALEMAYFQLPREVRLDKSQKAELHSIYTSAAPQLAQINQEIQQLNFENRRYAVAMGTKKGSKTMPEFGKKMKKLQDEQAAITKDTKNRVMELLTDKQREKIGAKDWKPEAAAKKQDPKKKKEKKDA